MIRKRLFGYKDKSFSKKKRAAALAISKLASKYRFYCRVERLLNTNFFIIGGGGTFLDLLATPLLLIHNTCIGRRGLYVAKEMPLLAIKMSA